MNTRIGRIGRILAPGVGTCERCHTPWRFVEEHNTPYQEITPPTRLVGRGCFPLCEKCWTDLGTPGARLPFYSQMFNEWIATGVYTDRPMEQQEDWEDILFAVLSGK